MLSPQRTHWKNRWSSRIKGVAAFLYIEGNLGIGNHSVSEAEINIESLLKLK